MREYNQQHDHLMPPKLPSQNTKIIGRPPLSYPRHINPISEFVTTITLDDVEEPQFQQVLPFIDKNTDK